MAKAREVFLSEFEGKATAEGVKALPADILAELLAQDELKVAEESAVIALVDAYMKSRDEIKPLLEEEEQANDAALVALLSEEEKKSREDAKAQKAEEALKAAEDAKAKEEEAFNALDDLGKI